MICIHHVQCNSETCPHKTGHPENDFCKGGSCSWGEDTHCVPEDHKEAVTNLLTGYVEDDLIGTLVDQIVRVFKEGNVEA